ISYFDYIQFERERQNPPAPLANTASNINYIYDNNPLTIVHTSVNKILNTCRSERGKVKKKKVKDHTFESLRSNFDINQLLQYEQSYLFKSLGRNVRKCITISINNELRSELEGSKKITQPIDVYVKRKTVVPLPNGIMSYTQFQRTNNYNLLSSVKKKRIQKIISMEKN
ncbi:hypothetical protein C1645_841511, partial [Glomus cerebriforme]